MKHKLISVLAVAIVAIAILSCGPSSNIEGGKTEDSLNVKKDTAINLDQGIAVSTPDKELDTITLVNKDVKRKYQIIVGANKIFELCMSLNDPKDGQRYRIYIYYKEDGKGNTKVKSKVFLSGQDFSKYAFTPTSNGVVTITIEEAGSVFWNQLVVVEKAPDGSDICCPGVRSIKAKRLTRRDVTSQGGTGGGVTVKTQQ